MNPFHRKIDRFLQTGHGDFGPLALELFRYQSERNRPYRSFCQALGFDPESVEEWQQIPAVPIAAFKSTELATFPIERAAAIFQSSGTTRQTPSRHYLKSLTYYETALKHSFSQWVLPDDASLPFFILAPAPAEAPHSSLSWMLDVVKRQWGLPAGRQGGPGSDFFVQRGRLDEPRLDRFLHKTEATQQPVALLGTTIAFLAFFDYARKTGQTYRLPLGSRLMDTGGMKTQQREVTRVDFVRQVGEILGILEDQCINEYGMCELGSQFYGRGVSSFLQGPPWVRTLVIDSASGQPASAGQPGLLRHFDLANVDSVLAIQTEDVGIAQENGFVFQGRDPHAEMKGCSVAAESFLR